MSKFPGPHIHSTARTDLVLRYLATCRPSVVKFMDAGLNAELLDAAKAIGALVVARPYRDPQEMNTAGRRAMLRDAESILRAWPQVDAVEGFNEAFQGGQELQERAGFDVDLMLLAERYGRKAVIGSFSVGMPDLPDHDRAEQWRLYLPALKRAGDQGHYVGLHEYGAPTLLWGVGAGNQTSDLVDGRWAPVKPAADAHGWFCLRYRQVVDVWRSLGLVTLPRIVISEFGLDDIQPRPAVGTRRGYKTYRDSEWWRHPSSGSFAEQCGWMASRWAEDPLVVGGVIFDFSDNTGKWDDFDPTTDPETFDELLRIGAKMATTPPKEPPVADLNALLAAEFGPGFYDDLRPLMADRPGFNTRPMAGVEAIAIHHTAARARRRGLGSGTATGRAASAGSVTISGSGWAGLPTWATSGGRAHAWRVRITGSSAWSSPATTPRASPIPGIWPSRAAWSKSWTPSWGESCRFEATRTSTRQPAPAPPCTPRSLACGPPRAPRPSRPPGLRSWSR